MRNAKTFLELCARRFPSTRPHQSHNLTFKDGKLVLTLMLGDTYQSFNIDDADLDRNPIDLVREVARLFKKSQPTTPDDIIA
jgi:hypothetical protein